MNRREFLKITGAAAVGAAVYGSVGTLVKKSMKKGKKTIAINGSPNKDGNTY